MSAKTLAERRAAYTAYKENVKERGKPFYPYAMFHDTVMSLIVVGVIIGLACVWHFTTTSDPNDCGTKHASCLLGPRYSDRADPGTTNFVPRPDWYFYFLFYLLRIFKWPNSVILGTIGIPTILLMLLIALPFLDLRRERRILRRPVALVAAALTALSMGVLTYKGATAHESLASEVLGAVPAWSQKQGFANNQQAVAGAKLFAQSGCTACHTYLGTGGAALGAPNLTDEGSKQKGIAFQIAHLKCPSCVNKGSPMPSFAAYGNSKLKQLATFLEASKGPK